MQERIIDKIFSIKKENIAIISENKTWTYKELCEKADAVQNLLINSGLSNQPIGVYMEMSMSTIAICLGIFKAKCIFVPLSVQEPENRTFSKIRQAEINAVFTDKTELSDVFECSRQKGPDGIESNFWINKKGVTRYSQLPEDCSYILFTSGSTGEPKGVMNTFTNLSEHVNRFIQKMRITDKDIYLGLSPIYFDSNFEEWLPILIQGGTFFLLDYARRVDSQNILDVMQKYNISLLSAPPQILALLNQKFEEKRYPALKKIFTGGDSLNYKHANHLIEHLEVWNGYGLTETTISTLWHQVSQRDTDEMPIGTPLVGSEVYILNESMRPVEQGEMGEIFIGGTCLAVGYLNDSQQTNQKFISHKGKRFIRTGDLGKFNLNNEIVFLGRNDRQVSVNGIRVELMEVENAIRSQEEITDCCVIFSEKEKCLICYVVLLEDSLSFDSLFLYLSSKLPNYMIPKRFLKIEAIPRTNTGKIKYKELKSSSDEEKWTFEVNPDEFTPTQKILSGIWSKQLGFDNELLPLDIPFYSFGGDSLDTIKIIADIDTKLGIKIQITDFYKHPTIALLDEFVRTNTFEKQLTLEDSSKEEFYKETTAAQKQIWYAIAQDGDSCKYNTVSAHRLIGQLDQQKFITGLMTIIERYPILKANFRMKDRLVQFINSTQLTVHLVDIKKEKESEKLIKSIIEAEKNYSFDLSNELLVRAKLIQVSEEECVFILSIHHLVTDNYSWKKILSTLSTFYEEKSFSDVEKWNYFDYAKAEHQWILDDRLKKSKQFWLEELENWEVQHLSLDRLDKRLDVTKGQGANITGELDQELVNKIGFYTKQQRVSEHSFLLASFCVLLSKYTNQKDLLIGLLANNRLTGETATMMGLLLNLISFRKEVKSDLSFSEFLQSVFFSVNQNLEHQGYPTEKIWQDLQSQGKELVHSPLSIVFDYHGDDTDIFKLKNLEIEELPIAATYAQNELTITVRKISGKMQIDFEYDTERYSQKFIEMLMERYRALIGNILEKPDQLMTEYSIFTARDKRQIKTYNSTEKEFTKEETILSLFEQAVAKMPEATAYQYENEILTYKELDLKSNQFAQWLKHTRKKQNLNLVAVYLEKGLLANSVILGILKAGMAYIPLDILHPAKHNQKIIQKAQPDLILVDRENADALLDFGPSAIQLDDIAEELNNYSTASLKISRSQEMLFSVMFTSGSTGSPKGVKVRDCDVLNRLQWYWEKYPFQINDVIGNHKSNVLIGSIWELFGGLLKNIPTILISKKNVINGDLLEYLVNQKITYFFASPPILTFLIDEKASKSQLSPRLRMVASSAEPITKGFINKWYKSFPETELLNLYGSTEDCSDVTFAVLKKDEEISVGYPVANVQITILDEDNKPLPPGIIGKVAVSGKQTSIGYINDELRTGKNFIWIKNEEGEELYAFITGDLGMISDQGLVIKGRSDFQQKIRGYLVNFTDIEASLRESSEIKNAAVVSFEKNGRQELIAYIASSGNNPTIPSIKKHLHERLPSYMIPNHFIFIDEIPYTPNGKVDHIKISKLKSSPTDDEYTEPRTPMENSIKEVWQNILNSERISIHASFFDSGGDSLKAVQLIGQIRHLFSVNLSIVQLFKEPTISEISRFVEQSLGNKEKEVTFYRNEPKQSYPLAYSQEVFYFYKKMEPKNIFYNIASNRIKGEFSLSIFEQALNKVIDRHDALRMRFIEQKGQPLINIVNNKTIFIEKIDLSYLNSEEEKNAEMIKRSREDIDTQFDFQNGPLIRSKCFSYGLNDRVIFINMSHIISDGWSINLLLGEISFFYNSLKNDFSDELDMPPIQFSDYILWQKTEEFEQLCQKQLDYWKPYLSKPLPELHLCGESKRPEVFSYDGGILEYKISPELTDQIKKLGSQYKSTLYMVLLSVYFITLHRYTRDEDLIVGSPIAGRGYPAIEKVIGCFVNTICIRENITSELTFLEILKNVRKDSLNAFSNADVPFDRLVQEINPIRNISRAPLFQTMLTVQEVPSNIFDIDNSSISDAGVINDLAPYDLSTLVWIEDKQATFYIEYYASIYSETFIDQFFSDYFNILNSVIADPQIKVKDIPLMLSNESQQIKEKWVLEKTLITSEKLEKRFKENLNNGAVLVILDENELPVKAGMVGLICFGRENNGIIVIEKTNTLGYFYDDIVYLLENEETSVYNEKKLASLDDDEIIKMTDIWQSVLSCESIDIDKSFFELGGNSLMIILLLELVEQKIGDKISITEFFKYPTIRKLVNYTREKSLDELQSKDINSGIQRRPNRRNVNRSREIKNG